MPIERGLAGPTLLADTIVRRWADHQPLSRQEGILAREGLDLAKSTQCGWHETLSELAGPLVAAMFVDALSCPYLCVDATGVLVQAPERCKVGHFWVMVAPEKHVLYRFSARHDAKAVDALLAGYSGYLVADAHAVYDHLYRDGAVIEVACWSHCRRYWFKALESDPDRAKLGLSLVGELFRIERAIANAPRKKREAIRSARSKPVVQKFFGWCESQRDDVLDKSPIATAIGYALNQRGALSRFLDDGRLPLHNNLSELNLRRQVLGRRNWLFLGSQDGATANTTFVTLLASCRLHDLEPLGYIRDLLCLLPSWPRHRVLDLAPAYWQQTLEQPETQQKLDANVFPARHPRPASACLIPVGPSPDTFTPRRSTRHERGRPNGYYLSDPGVRGVPGGSLALPRSSTTSVARTVTPALLPRAARDRAGGDPHRATRPNVAIWLLATTDRSTRRSR